MPQQVGRTNGQAGYTHEDPSICNDRVRPSDRWLIKEKDFCVVKVARPLKWRLTVHAPHLPIGLTKIINVTASLVRYLIGEIPADTRTSNRG